MLPDWFNRLNRATIVGSPDDFAKPVIAEANTSSQHIIALRIDPSLPIIGILALVGSGIFFWPSHCVSLRAARMQARQSE
jgi:hypothetical protein